MILLKFIISLGLVPVFLMLWSAPAQSGDAGLLEDDLFRNHGVAMLIIDADSGAIVDANRAAISYYGYPREELVAMSIHQINTFTKAQMEQEFQRVVREQRNYFLFEHRLADGQVRPVEVYSWPVRRDGARTLLLSMIHDISQRRAMEQDLVESEARLRFAEQVAKIGHWTFDLAGRTYEFSEGALNLLGLEGNVWPADAIVAMVLPEDRSQMAQLRQDLIDGQQEYRINLRFQRPDGAIIDLFSQGIYDTEARALFGILHDTTRYHEAMRTLKSRTMFFLTLAGTGLVVQLLIICLLIHHAKRRKKAEAALRESEQRFDQLAHQNRSIVWEVDRHGRFTYISQVAATVLGYQPEEMIGRIHFYDLHPQAGREEFKADIFATFQQRGTITDLENQVVTNAGKSLWMATTGLPRLDEQGSFVGYRGSSTDISERKTILNALTMKSQEIEQFVYTISHDLKSPLVTVKMFLNFLEEDIKAENAEQVTTHIDYIRGAAEKIEQLLDALLQLSRVGRIDNLPVCQTLPDLVTLCQNSLAGTIAQKQVKITTTALPITMYGDPLQFGQIWQNLVENAIKYMGDQQQPWVKIGAEQQGGDIIFFVSDNGMGIAPEDATRIFGVFAQLDPHSEGSGLGLALVKKIVEKYEGTIWVESQGKGAGSCFKFTLPTALSYPSEGL